MCLNAVSLSELISHGGIGLKTDTLTAQINIRVIVMVVALNIMRNIF